MADITALNKSGNQSSPMCDPNLPFVETITFCCLHGISGMSSLTGNLLVLLAIYRTRQLQNAHNMFIASLATADFLVGLICPLYIAIVILRVWVTDHVLYKIENFLWIQTLVATTFSLCAVSVDRYYAVTSAVRYRALVTARKCKVIIVIIWLISCVLASLSFFMETDEQEATLFFTTQVLTVGAPLLIISYCYVYIFKAARAQGQGIGNASGTDEEADRRQAREKAKHRKTALTIAIIVGLFVVLFTPNFVFSVLVLMVCDPCQRMLYYRDWYWGVLIVFLSSATNPWIYAIRMREFRKAMRTIFRKVLPCSVFLNAREAVCQQNVHRIHHRYPRYRLTKYVHTNKSPNSCFC